MFTKACRVSVGKYESDAQRFFRLDPQFVERSLNEKVGILFLGGQESRFRPRRGFATSGDQNGPEV